MPFILPALSIVAQPLPATGGRGQSKSCSSRPIADKESPARFRLGVGTGSSQLRHDLETLVTKKEIGRGVMPRPMLPFRTGSAAAGVVDSNFAAATVLPLVLEVEAGRGPQADHGRIRLVVPDRIPRISTPIGRVARDRVEVGDRDPRIDLSRPVPQVPAATIGIALGQVRTRVIGRHLSRQIKVEEIARRVARDTACRCAQALIAQSYRPRGRACHARSTRATGRSRRADLPT